MTMDASVGDSLERPLELDPDLGWRGHGGHYAVVDVGSNSVRLVVYDTLSRAPFPRFNEKSLCGLGAGLERTGKLADDAVDRTLHALHRYVAVAKAMEVDRVDIIATEAVRRARNGSLLVKAIAKETGLTTRVLNGKEEARFAALGVISGFYRPKGLVGDLGGGSLEIAEVVDDQVGERLVSLPLGALPVKAMMDDDSANAKKSVDAVMRGQLPPPLADPTFYAVGGGWRALARVHMVARKAPVKITHGYEIDAKDARAFAKDIRRKSDTEIAAQPGVPTRRVKTLRAAALVMDRVLKQLKPERVIFSALGLREGWLYEQLEESERYLDPLILGAQAFGVPRSRVPAFGAVLARWTEELFPGEAVEEKRLRLAACALSDIAWSDHPEVRARQSFERLIQFPFVGVDHRERVQLAAIIHARYGGKPEDPELMPAIGLLQPSQLRRAQILGRTMLLAYRFSGSVPEILDTARIRIDADRVRLEVSDTASVPDSETVRDRLKGLAKVIGVHRSEIVKVDVSR